MRLIDADELMEHVWRDKLDSRELIAKMIDNAPTVEEISTKIPITVFKQLISQQSSKNCISRQAVKEQMIKYGFHAPDMTVTEFVEDLPPVTPQPKTGHWIYKQYDGYPECGNWHCSECDEIDNRTSAYCPNCGAKMVEPQAERGVRNEQTTNESIRADKAVL